MIVGVNFGLTCGNEFKHFNMNTLAAWVGYCSIVLFVTLAVFSLIDTVFAGDCAYKMTNIRYILRNMLLTMRPHYWGFFYLLSFHFGVSQIICIDDKSGWLGDCAFFLLFFLFFLFFLVIAHFFFFFFLFFFLSFG